MCSIRLFNRRDYNTYRNCTKLGSPGTMAREISRCALFTELYPGLIHFSKIDPFCKNSNFQWLGYNIVNSTVAIILMFMYLQAWYLGIHCKSNPEQDKRVRKLIEKSWKDLGKMTQEEILVLIAFAILVLSWFFREPGFMKGTNSFPTANI